MTRCACTGRWNDCRRSSRRSARPATRAARCRTCSARSSTRSAQPCTRAKGFTGLQQAVVRAEGPSASVQGLPEAICLGGQRLPKNLYAFSPTLYAFSSAWYPLSSALHAYRKICRRTTRSRKDAEPRCPRSARLCTRRKNFAGVQLAVVHVQQDSARVSPAVERVRRGAIPVKFFWQAHQRVFTRTRRFCTRTTRS